MEQSLCWFFDAVAVGIILIFVYVGAKKGFVRNIAYTVLIIASFLASWFAAEALAPFVYDTFVKEEITQLLYERADSIRPAEIISQTVSDGDYGVEMSESEISQIMSGSSDFFAGLATEMRKNGSPESEKDIASGVRDAATPRLLDSLFSGASDSIYIRQALDTISQAGEKVEQVISSLVSGSAQRAAETVERELVAPTVKWILKAIIFIICLFILRLIIKPLSETLTVVNKIPVVGSVNVLMGAALGIVEGAVFVYVCAVAVKAIIKLSSNSLIFFNTDTVNSTRLFIHFYNFDILSLF